MVMDEKSDDGFETELDDDSVEESEESDAPMMSNEDEGDENEDKLLGKFGFHPIDEEEGLGM